MNTLFCSLKYIQLGHKKTLLCNKITSIENLGKDHQKILYTHRSKVSFKEIKDLSITE